MKDVGKNLTAWFGCRWATLIGVCVAEILIPLNVAGIGVALDSIGQSLQASFADLQWVLNAYNVAIGSFLLASGSLADRFGRRRMFALGLVVFTTASLLCGFSQNPLMLDFFRALQGIGAAFVLTGGSAVLANEFRGESRAFAFSILGASFGLGFALGPFLAGVLTSGLGWQCTFWLNVPIGFGVLALAIPKMKESRDSSNKRLDWAGFITFSLTLFLFILALVKGPSQGWGSPLIVGTLLSAGATLGLFIFVERWQRQPMFDLTLFRKPTFIAVSLLPIAFTLGLVSLLIYMPLYFQGVNGYSPLQTGLVMLTLTLPLFIMPPISGRLAVKVPARVLLSAGFVLFSLGDLSMLRIQAGSSWTAVLVGFILTGIGAGTINGVVDNVAVSVVPPEQSGMAAGIFNTMRTVGDTVSIAGLGAVLVSLIQFRLPGLIAAIPAVAQGRSAELASRIARGDIQGVAASLPVIDQGAFVQAANQSYIQALQTLLLMLAGISFTAAVVMFKFVRVRDIVDEPTQA